MMNQPSYRIQSGSALAIGRTNWSAAAVGLLFFALTQIVITQRFAALFYQPGLHIPGAYLWWIIRNAFHPDPRTSMHDLYTTFAGIPVSIFGAALITRGMNAAKYRAANEGAEDLHGSARFANEEEIRDSAFAKARNGPYIGAWEPEPGRLEYLRDDSDEHIVGTAPSGSGKSAGLVMPTLLDCPNYSMIVLDPKGSLHQKTSGYRAQHGNVYKFAPVSERGSRYNLFGEIRLFTKHDFGDADNLSQTLTHVPGEGSVDPHWDDIAGSLGTGIILHAAYKARAQGRAANGLDIAMLITPLGTKKVKLQEVEDHGNPRVNPDGTPLVKEVEEPLTFIDTLAEMVSFEHDPEGRHGGWTIRNPDGKEIATLTHPAVRKSAMEMLGRVNADGPNNEFSGAKSSLEKRFTLYFDELIQDSTSHSDFTIEDLVNGHRPASLYFVLPLSDQKRLIPYARAFLTTLFNRLTEQKRITQPNRWPLLVALEEFPTLEKMEVFNDRLAQIREYKVRCLLIAQSDKQITDKYGVHNSIYNNCGRQIAYAPNDNDTAKMLSEMTGSRTVQQASSSFSGDLKRISPDKVQTHIAHVQRPLMTPEEVRRLQAPVKEGELVVSPGASLIFANGCRPIFGRQMLYFFDPEFRRRAALPEVTEWPRKSALV